MPVFIKGLISVLLCICTVSGSSLPDVAPQMERYHVEKAGMTISLPSQAHVTDRTVERDYAPLERFGMSADQLELQYKKGSIYCNAIWFPEDTEMTEILVTVSEDDDSRTIFQLDDFDQLHLQAMADSYASFIQQGQEVSAIYSSASVVRNNQAAFIKAHGARASDDAAENHLHFMTIVNGKRIGITLIEHCFSDQPYTGNLRVSEENEMLMDQIVSELTFDAIENEFVAKNKGYLAMSGVIIAVCTVLLAAYYISERKNKAVTGCVGEGVVEIDTQAEKE